MKFIGYLSFRLLAVLFYIIPFPVVYLISDFIYFLLYKAIKYRKNVVLDNLEGSFPDKSKEEIEDLAKAFYHHLADITLESVKSMTISRKSLAKRYKILNNGIADEYFEKSQSILCFTSHYGNWEYGILSTGNTLKHQAIALYLKLANKYTEKYGVKRRMRFGTQMIPVQDSKRIFTDPQVKPVAIILAADQSPSNLEKAIWIRFLNRETACLHGPEAYAKKTNFPVVYFKIAKQKRGYYSLEIEKLIEDPSAYDSSEITRIYMNRLEKDIREKPEYWLWSHRRWKHKRK